MGTFLVCAALHMSTIGLVIRKHFRGPSATVRPSLFHSSWIDRPWSTYVNRFYLASTLCISLNVRYTNPLCWNKDCRPSCRPAALSILLSILVPRASVFWSRGLQNSEHLRSVQKNTSGFPVAEHCNSLLYSLSDIAVGDLRKSTGVGFRRKQLKIEIISRLGTMHSEGLNWFRSLHSNSRANAFTLKKGYT